MRYATIATPEGSAIAAVEGDDAWDLTPALSEAGHRWVDLSQAFAAEGGFDAVKAAAKTTTSDPLATDAARFLSPLPRPDHVLAVAANYKAHIEETGTITYAAKAETSPWFFTKPQSSINGHQSPIRLPAKYGDQVDWEAELGVVIGKGGGSIAPEDAWDHIAGYTVVNDISARRMQVPERTTLRERDSFHDWLHGKWFDTFCCVGPWIVAAEDFPHPDDVEISLTLNGDLKQQASTKMMIFPIPELIAFISSIVTLRPGDLIATGTPEGTGKSIGRFLAESDVVAASVVGIGTLTNPVERAPDHA
jgi:2,4-didehydro-3-deoxy-L-rhamnonate hydrolase